MFILQVIGRDENFRPMVVDEFPAPNLDAVKDRFEKNGWTLLSLHVKRSETKPRKYYRTLRLF